MIPGRNKAHGCAVVARSYGAVRCSRLTGLLQHGRRSFSSSNGLLHAQDWHLPRVGPSRKIQVLPSLRRCLVTGGASGIGYEVSKQLVLNGASAVVIVSRTAEKAQQAIERIKNETGCDDAPLGFAESNFQDMTGLFKGQIAKLDDCANGKPFNTLINCAGVSQTQGLLSTSTSTVADILRINLHAPMELSRQLLKSYFRLGSTLAKATENDMEPDTTSFCVINVSSLLAERGGQGASAYAASKAGLTAFTRTLVLEAASINAKFSSLPAFRANVVVPGYIDTPMIENFSSAQKKKLVADIPLKRYGTAEEVAQAIIFLLNNEYASNTVLNLDGGLSAA